ncbi:MAG TPA: hypothetical protein H9786_05025 [Candidatus Brachybacterium merdavium]|uniref:Uncharacterized protein n=1 Tax=Candidatus Brachybacterium merdavium TaxID=2838513 RepID=A0A9D2LC80_9MICO|nr:hypothetical protein [Candidatus Brachybacterium merdavium]
MLHLVTPQSSVYWSDMPEQVLDIARRSGGDLGQLEWLPTEEPHDYATAVRVALRHGEMCSRGIVFRAWELIKVERPAMLTERLRATQQADAALAGNDQLMEALMPGWIEHGRKLSQDVERSVNESIAEAQEDADTVLNAPVLPHVESGWKRMGGSVI